MNKTKIEWCDYTINPVKGLCPKACSYCYARAMYKRFKWNPEIRYDPNAFKGLPSEPSRVFVGSTIDLFGSWVERDWWHMIMAKCLSRLQHTFMFLTKYPQNLPKKFPDNCWVGVSATDYRMATDACGWLDNVEAKIKFISLEPLLAWNSDKLNTSAFKNWISDINWLIIGAMTGTRYELLLYVDNHYEDGECELSLMPYGKKWTLQPKIEWVKEIVEAADKAGVKVFLKDSLKPLLPHKRPFYREVSFGGSFLVYRQEIPNV